MRNLEKDEIEMAARREAMLREGFRLFSEKGIEAVPMQEVAKACGLGIATLYRYYNTKLALVLDIGTRQWTDYLAYAQDLSRELGTEKWTAAKEMEFYLDFYIDLYRNHKDLLRFNQNFNNYVQHEGATKEQMAPYLTSVGRLGGLAHRIYEKGKQDGTIRTDMPEAKMFATTAHIMLAVGVRFAQGLLYDAENEADRTEEFEFVKRMILREYVTA